MLPYVVIGIMLFIVMPLIAWLGWFFASLRPDDLPFGVRHRGEKLVDNGDR